MNKGVKNELTSLLTMLSLAALLIRKPGLAGLLGLLAVGSRWLPTKSFSFDNRVVVITGGSRGLGLALAQEALKRHAKVALLARDINELNEAVHQLASNRVLAVPCDVTQPEAVKQAVETVKNHLGGVDVLINNAGSIVVGPFETMTEAEFDAQFQLHVNAVLHCIHACLNTFRGQGGGRIANIVSIGGLVAVPHMSSYCASKFALAGLSETLAAELAADNIAVTTVYPGLMRTGSPMQALFKGHADKEYAWFATGDAMPGLSVSAKEAAHRILDGIHDGAGQVAFPQTTRLAQWSRAFFPELTGSVMRTVAWLLPKSNNMQLNTGSQSNGWLNRQWWYQLLYVIQKQAERQYNQKPHHQAAYQLGIK